MAAHDRTPLHSHTAQLSSRWFPADRYTLVHILVLRRYPNATYIPRVFDAVFGRHRERSRTCAFEIEPNPLHRSRQQSLQQAYRRTGWRYYYIPAAVSTTNETSMTFYHNQNFLKGSANEEWTFGIRNGDRNSPIGNRVRVRALDFASFLEQLPGVSSAAGHARVVVKMDIEVLCYDPRPANNPSCSGACVNITRSQSPNHLPFRHDGVSGSGICGPTCADRARNTLSHRGLNDDRIPPWPRPTAPPSSLAADETGSAGRRVCEK